MDFNLETDTNEIKVEELIDSISNLKDLFNIDLPSASDNIIRLEKICEILYLRIIQLEKEVKKIES